MSNDEMLDVLAEWGADVSNAMKSMLDDKQFYRDCLNKLFADPSFSLLGRQLKAGDLDGAFSSAHMLKGITATLGLTPISKPIYEIVEILRKRESEGTEDLYKLISERHKELGKILSEE
ncbi:MAG: Hpt domain-containing protein [Clostridia bacterium]|nr:Hpt domain-containing protein [Clostridia bacterium]